MFNMVKNANDPIRLATDAARAALTADGAAENKTAAIAYAVSVLLGDADAFGSGVVPMLQWAQSPEAMKSIRLRVLSVCDCDSAAITLARKGTGKAADKLVNEKNGMRAKFTKAIELLGAMAIMNDRTGYAATWVGDKWQMPIQWFMPEGFKAMPSAPGAFPPVTFDGPLSSPKVAAFDADGDATSVPIKPHMSWLIGTAYDKKRGARPGGNDKAETDAGNDGTTNGTDGAKASHKANATPTEARDVVAKEAGRDDYKWRPTGEVATDWQTTLDTMAMNPYFRAMMVRAISRANKEEAASASATA
jgi:hypothetical protein